MLEMIRFGDGRYCQIRDCGVNPAPGPGSFAVKGLQIPEDVIAEFPGKVFGRSGIKLTSCRICLKFLLLQIGTAAGGSFNLREHLAMKAHFAGNLRIIKKHRDIESPDALNAGFQKGVRDKFQSLKILPEFLNKELLLIGKRHDKIRCRKA